MGTPDFISPEQAVDARNVDGRSDIYSLGMTLYYLLAGHVPFVDGSAEDKLRQHAEAEPRPLSELRGDIPDELEQVFVRMTAKDPNARFQSPKEVADALNAIPPVEPASAPLASRQLGTRRFSKPLAVVALLGIVTALFAFLANRSTTERDVRSLNAFLESGRSDEPAGDIVRRLLRSEEGRSNLRILDARHQRLAYADGLFTPGYTAVAAIVCENRNAGVAQPELQVMGWSEEISGMQKHKLTESVRLDSVRFDKSGDDTTLAKLYFVIPEKESVLGLRPKGLYEGEVEIPGLLGQTKQRIRLVEILKQGTYIREANKFELAGKIEKREDMPGYGTPTVATRESLVGRTLSREGIAWTFTEKRVTISSSAPFLPAEAAEVLNDQEQHGQIDASWELTTNQKLRLYEIQVDGKAADHEAVLRISLAGYLVDQYWEIPVLHSQRNKSGTQWCVVRPR